MDTPDAEVSSSSLPSSLYRVSPASRELPAVGTAVNEAGMAVERHSRMPVAGSHIRVLTVLSLLPLPRFGATVVSVI